MCVLHFGTLTQIYAKTHGGVGGLTAGIMKGSECFLNTFFLMPGPEALHTQNFTALLYCEHRHCCLVTAMSKK